MTLTKSYLIESISQIKPTKKGAEKVLENLLENIKYALATGEDFLISGFGKFCAKNNIF